MRSGLLVRLPASTTSAASIDVISRSFLANMPGRSQVCSHWGRGSQISQKASESSCQGF